MCVNCLGSAELAVMQGTAVAAFARAGLVRGREWLTGTDPLERRLAAHRANAAFLASMGLDPNAVLGPAPTAPATTRRTVRVPAISVDLTLAGG